MAKNLDIAAPWVIYYKRIFSLFKYDPEVKVEYDSMNNEIKVFVSNGRKYDAISVLLPPEKTFGNVTVKTTVIPANSENNPTWTDLFRDAFNGNPIFSCAEHLEGQLGTFDYMVFKPTVAQYYSDNLFDINGMTTELYQDLAKEVFETGNDAVRFCTDVPVLDID